MSVTKEGKSISLAPVDGSTVSGTVNKKGITYSNLFPNTDAHYYVNGNSVKEDLVLNSCNNQNTFSYEIKLNGAKASTESDGTIIFTDNSGKKLWYFQKSFMTDANGKYSDKVTLTLRKVKGKTFVDVTADSTFLQDSNTKYPVTIDPTIDSWNVMTDAYISATNPNTAYSAATSMYTGLTPSYGATRALGQFYLPALPSSSKITSANFNAYQYRVDATNVTIDLFRNTSGWTHTTNWNTQPTVASTRESTITSNVSGAYWQWDITLLTKDWYNGVLANNGFTLKQENETTSPYRAFNAVESAINSPRLTINYTVDPIGTESYWGFSKDNVNTANGNLVLQQGDLSIPGRGIPVSIGRTYNSRKSNFAGMFGYGWRSDVEAQLVDSGSGPITLIDADGTCHIFGENTTGGYYAVDGIYLSLVKNGGGTYTITQNDGTIINFNTSGKISSMVDTNSNSTNYTYASGKLTTITDASGRTTTIAYGTNGYVSSVTYNPTSQTVTYNYDASGNLIKVTDPAGKFETFGSYDTDHNLGTITDERSITTTISYDVPNDRVASISRPITIDGVQQTSTTNYKYYTAYGVTSVTDGEGKRVDYSYNTNGNILQITANPLDAANKAVTVYAFDGSNNLTLMKDGNTNKADSYHNAFIYSYDGSGDVTGVTQQRPDVISSTDGYISTYDIRGNVTGTQLSGGQIETSTYDSKNNETSSTDPMNNTSNNDFDAQNNNIDSIDPIIQTNANRYFSNGNTEYSTAQMSAADNITANSSFEIDLNSDNQPDNWTQLVESGKTAAFAWTSTSKIGNKAVSITNPTGWASESSDMTPCTPANKFVVSAYVKTANTMGTAYVKADFYDTNNVWLGQSVSNGIKGTNDWTRLQAVVDSIPANTAKIRATVGMNPGTGTAYFDGVQLEKGTVLSAYNLIDNSSFERNAGLNTLPANWTDSNNLSASDKTDNSNPYVGSFDFKLTGESSKNKYVKQRINFSGTSDTRFTLSGWSKQLGASTSGGNYQMMVSLNNSSGSPLEWHGNDFNKTTLDWQHVAAKVKSGVTFSSIDVYYYYYDQTGTAWFDAMRLEVGDNVTEYIYDSGGNYVTDVTNGLGNTVTSTYDGAGNTLTAKDAKNKTTSFQYGISNLLNQVTDAKAGITSFGYDNAGNMTSVTDARNKVTNYAYNEFNQTSSITNALNQVTQFGYNKNGASNKVIFPKGDSITSAFDALNQLSGVSYNGVQKWSYGYDANGNVKTINNIAAGTTTSNTFDKNGSVTNVAEGASNSFGYSYDDNLNMTLLTATAGSTTIKTGFTFNELNQPTTLARTFNLATPVTQAKFVYDERGNVISVRHANGTYTAYEYDSVGSLTSVKNFNTSGTLLDSYSYLYDANGNRISVTNATGTINYQYDELNRLTQETLLDGTIISNVYDAVGNRTQKTVGATITNYTYDNANELTAVNSQAYTYDANGNLTSNGTKTFVYNEVNQLTQVKTSAGTVIASYTYDDTGRRTSVTASGATSKYHYSGDKVIYVTDASNAVIADYTYDAAGNPATITYGGVTYYYHLDGHGSVTSMTDGSGNIAAQYAYDAWGNILSQSGSMASINPLRYSGYRYDEATGLYYLMARYYNLIIKIPGATKVAWEGPIKFGFGWDI